MELTNAVLSEKQARQITGGRKPHVPVQYEQAVQALAECLSLDEAKVWSAKSDALAAWAKIYRDDDVGRKARALKLHAFRRMGELAREQRPGKIIPPPKGCKGHPGFTRLPGPKSLLEELGLKASDANACLSISKMKLERFENAINSPKPPSPNTLTRRGAHSSITYQRLSPLFSVRSMCRLMPPEDAARSLHQGEMALVVPLVREVIDWLDAFDQYLSTDSR